MRFAFNRKLKLYGCPSQVVILFVTQNGGDDGKLNLDKEECGTSGVTSEGQPTLGGVCDCGGVVDAVFLFCAMRKHMRKLDNLPVDHSLDTSPVFFTLTAEEGN